eukprot:TRINITY_DN78_c0_g1_i11.p1 TRINITY_DN78_c0_g1~~TRINITY_DN78_c0_g1_i11.p1  ORF type:complete len:355 (-),score=69.73 TRINITY_DN78_c0_g1_i11:301-1365(-)
MSASVDKSVFNKEKDVVSSDREFKALHDFVPTDPKQIPLTRGDPVTVIEKPEGGWWKGTCKGQTGYFPASYVEPIKLIKKKPLAHTSNFIKKLQKDAGLVEESSSDDETTKRLEKNKEKMQRRVQETLSHANQKHTAATQAPTVVTPEQTSFTAPATSASVSQPSRPISPSRASLSNRARPSTEAEIPETTEEQKSSFAEPHLPRTPSEKRMLEAQEVLAESVSSTLVTDPSTIFRRIFYSLLPTTSPVVSDDRVDMIGPALVFVIVSAVLLFSGPHSTIHDARTVILTLFLYWMTSSLVCYLICIVFRIKIKLFQIYSLIVCSFLGPQMTSRVLFDTLNTGLRLLWTFIGSCI